MATYERDLRVRAPLADVWAFHSTVDGLRALTPDWMGLRVEAIEHSDGDRDAHVLTAGTRIRLSVRPFGVGPRQRWVSRIVESEERDGIPASTASGGSSGECSESDGVAYLVDEMVEGPFPEWRHEHLFYGDGDETLLRDRVTYRAPAGGVGTALTSAFFEPTFRYRHRRTREILEGT